VNVKAKRPSLTDDSNDEILDYFVDEVLQMKREVLPLKKHLGSVLFEMLFERNSSARKSLEDLRDFAEGQYYSILSQGKQTFGLEPKTDSTVNPKTKDQKKKNLKSLKTQDSGVEMRQYFDFTFDLDFIVKIRRMKHVITIEEGKAVTPNGKFGNTGFDSSTMIRRGTLGYKEANIKLFGDSSKFRKFFKENSVIRKIRKQLKIPKCFKKSKKKNKDSLDMTENPNWVFNPLNPQNLVDVGSRKLI
jgi:hypothetical protein